MSDNELKREILRFIKDFYLQNGEPPSVRSILESFEGLSRKRFYQIFPDGVSEAHRLAGVPVSKERLEQTAKATERIKMGRDVVEEQEDVEGRITLSEEQTKRLLGISHLEGGRDPLQILDELLDYDSALRSMDLDLSQVKMIQKFLSEAQDRGWKLDSKPNLLNHIAGLYNVGFTNFEPRTINALVRLIQEIERNGWTVKNFVGYVTRIYKMLIPYIAYMHGQISYEEFRRRVEPYVKI